MISKNNVKNQERILSYVWGSKKLWITSGITIIFIGTYTYEYDTIVLPYLPFLLFHLDFYFCAYWSYTDTFFTFGHIYFYMFNAMSKEILGVNNFRKRVCATAQLHATIFSKVTICDYNRHFGISKIGFCKISFSMASHSWMVSQSFVNIICYIPYFYLLIDDIAQSMLPLMWTKYSKRC